MVTEIGSLKYDGAVLTFKAQDAGRVPTRSGNREKVGNFVIGREVGKMSGKTKHLKKLKCCCVGKKVLFLYRDLDLGLDLFAF